MATNTQQQQAPIGTGDGEGSRAAPEHEGQPTAARLTTEQVWRQLAKASFAVLSYVTPAGEPRSSGVLYKTVGRRLYIVTAPDSWKARHVAASGRVAVTVPVRRGTLLSLVLPIPPATVSFHGTAVVYPADSSQVRPLLRELASLVPQERRASAAVVEVVPGGFFVTYGVGVSLARMRDPAAARARLPVTQGESAR
jgi:nitroimidazol reductase NimA-like FMN-containing flavoprotein (pyridoxamine 5'-phosphate oxidase superfamily)